MAKKSTGVFLSSVPSVTTRFLIFVRAFYFSFTVQRRMLVLLIQCISLSAVFFYLGRVSILITCRTYNQPNHFLTYLLRPHGLHEYSLFFHTHPLPSAFFYIHYFFMIVPFLFSFFFLSYPSS